jgi:hypothetical protein
MTNASMAKAARDIETVPCLTLPFGLVHAGEGFISRAPIHYVRVKPLGGESWPAIHP